MSARDKANRVLIHVILILVSITMLVPFLWMILTAFKTMTEATSVNPFVILPSTWRWDSFKEVIENMDFLHLYINTLLLILGRVVCAVLTATLAGYAFGRLNFRGKNLMFSLVLFQMMVPGQIFIIPQYLMVSKMGMLNTIFALVFPGIVTAFGTFLLKQAYMGLPKDLEEAARLAAKFISKLPAMRRILATDVEAAYNGDPAAESYGEVIFCYPAIKAISNYRIAHELLELGVPLIPRIITEMAHSETGIDIHPAAKIGTHFTIDHGTGVVIGATSIIGNNVKLYQGVTLGAKSFPLDADGKPIKGIPRHPILEDNVIVYSNATILGRITIGRDATVGGNIWVTENVPAGARIVQTKAKK